MLEHYKPAHCTVHQTKTDTALKKTFQNTADTNDDFC